MGITGIKLEHADIHTQSPIMNCTASASSISGRRLFADVSFDVRKEPYRA